MCILLIYIFVYIRPYHPLFIIQIFYKEKRHVTIPFDTVTRLYTIQSTYTSCTEVRLSENSAYSHEHISCTAHSILSYNLHSKNMPSISFSYQSYISPNYPGIRYSRSLHIHSLILFHFRICRFKCLGTILILRRFRHSSYR